MNVLKAIYLARLAARNGRISENVQNRVIRRLSPPSESTRRWGRLMGMAKAIHREIHPEIEKQEHALSALLYREARSERMIDFDVTVSKRVTNIPMDPALNADWWKAAGEREKARKQARQLIED